MAKINIPPIRGGFNLSKINSAIETIEDHLNSKVLYRDNPEGEPNQMLNDLDMNGNRIYNLPSPTEQHEVATKDYVDKAAIAVPVESFIRTDPDEVLNELPEAMDRAGKVLTFDANGQPTVQYPASDSATQLRMDLQEYAGTLGGFPEWSDVPAHSDPAFDVQAQALADRTEWLKDKANIFDAEKQWGVGNDGDSTQSLQDAIDYVSSVGGGVLVLPPVEITHSAPIHPRSGVKLIGWRNQTILRLADGSNCSSIDDEFFDTWQSWSSGQPTTGYVVDWFIDGVIIEGNGQNQSEPTSISDQRYGYRLNSHRQGIGWLVVRGIAGVGVWTSYNSALMSHFRYDIDGVSNAWPQRSMQTTSDWEQLFIQDCLYEHFIFDGPADCSIKTLHTNYCGWVSPNLESVNPGAAKTSLNFPGEEIHSFRQHYPVHINYANLNGAVCGRAFYVPDNVRITADTLILNGSWGQGYISGNAYGTIGNIILQMTMFEWGGVSHPMLHLAKGSSLQGRLAIGQIVVRQIGTWAAYSGECVRDDQGQSIGSIIHFDGVGRAGHFLTIGSQNRGGRYGHVKAIGLTGIARDGKTSSGLVIEDGAQDWEIDRLDLWRNAIGIDNQAPGTRGLINSGVIRVNESGATGQIAMQGIVPNPAIASVVAISGVAVSKQERVKWGVTVIDNSVIYRNSFRSSAAIDTGTTGLKTSNVDHAMWRIPDYDDVQVTPRWGGGTWPQGEFGFRNITSTYIELVANVRSASAGTLTLSVCIN